MEINLSKDGTLRHKVAHVYHTIEDHSAVDVPKVTYGSINMYTPIYSEKGPSGIIRTFTGNGAAASLIDTYGNPDVRRYGLPYSMAALHTKLGGAVTVQSLKPEGATHGSVIVTMTLEHDHNNATKVVGYYNKHPLAILKATPKNSGRPIVKTILDLGEVLDEVDAKYNGVDYKISLKPISDNNSRPQTPYTKYYLEYLWGIDDDVFVARTPEKLGQLLDIPEIKNVFAEADVNGENRNVTPTLTPTRGQVLKYIRNNWKNTAIPENGRTTVDPVTTFPGFDTVYNKLNKPNNKTYANFAWDKFDWFDIAQVDPQDSDNAKIYNLRVYNKALDELNVTLANVKTYLESSWEPIKIPALTIKFKSKTIEEILAEAKKNTLKDSDNTITENKFGGLEYRTLATLTGVTSWDALEYIVRNITPSANSKASKQGILRDHNSIMKNLENSIRTGSPFGASFSYEVPILWGYCIGKGKYGNDFLINFANIKSDINGRPVMEATIYDTKKEIALPGSKKAVSINNDFVTGTPVLLDSAYARPNYEGDFKFATASHDVFDGIGTILESFIKVLVSKGNNGAYKFNEYEPVLNGGTSYGPEGDLFIKNLLAYADLFVESEDSNYHRLQYLDLTRVHDLPFTINSSGIQHYSFNGGHEGELQFMKEFDWDFNFEDPKLNAKYGLNSASDPDVIELFEFYKRKYGPRRIVEEMFANAFSGAKNPEIRSLFSNAADYIIDAGYPISVKNAIIELCEERDEIFYVLNTSIGNTTIDQSVREKLSIMNKDSRNAFYLAGDFEWVDPDSQRSVRVPASFAMLKILFDHYNEGYSSSICGVDRGAVEFVQPYSLRGVGNLTLAENDILHDAGINHFTANAGGRVYLDSQITNYHTGKEISSLQEVHNNSIINRIIKDCYIQLQKYKHLLANDDTVSFVQERVNQNIMAKYNTKVASLSYTCKFNSGYDKAIGLLSHSIDIQFNNTIKYHHVTIKALPIT